MTAFRGKNKITICQARETLVKTSFFYKKKVPWIVIIFILEIIRTADKLTEKFGHLYIVVCVIVGVVP